MSNSTGSTGNGSETAGAGLTERQRTILEVIRASVTTRGYPPSIREIGDAVGLTSTSSVAHQLRTLERKGYLRRDANRPRAVDVRGADELATPVTEVAGSDALPEPTFVPVLGRIAAGGPILAEEAVEDVFPLPRELVGEGSLFLLKVVGESMVDAAICDGDWVVIRQQNVGKHRASAEFEFVSLLIEDVEAGDIAGQQIGGTLSSREVTANGRRQCLGQSCLAKPWFIFQQQMPA